MTLDFEKELDQASKLSHQVEEEKHGNKQGEMGEDAGPNATSAINDRMKALGLNPSPSGLDMDYYRRLARSTEPAIALAGLRMELETLARNLAIGFKVDVPEHASNSRLLDELQREGAITYTQFALARRVLSLCNQAIHGAPVTQEQADAVITSAETLAEQYESWLEWGFPESKNM